MELKDIISTGLAVVAIIISIFTLFISHKWNKEGTKVSWEREKKLPFFTKLSVFLDELDSIYIVDYTVEAKKHSYSEYTFEANILGLDDIYEALLRLELLERRMRGEKFKRGIQEKTLQEYRDEMIKIYMYIEQDRVRLTK